MKVFRGAGVPATLGDESEIVQGLREVEAAGRELLANLQSLPEEAVRRIKIASTERFSAKSVKSRGGFEALQPKLVLARSRHLLRIRTCERRGQGND